MTHWKFGLFSPGKAAAAELHHPACSLLPNAGGLVPISSQFCQGQGNFWGGGVEMGGLQKGSGVPTSVV